MWYNVYKEEEIVGKFCLKDTNKDLGISLYNAICPVGSRVAQNYKYGNITIAFDEVMQARIYINGDVLRKALLSNVSKTKQLLGINVSDARVAPVAQVEKIIDSIEKETSLIQEALDVLDLEIMEEEKDVEDLTEDFVLTVETTPEFDSFVQDSDEAPISVSLNHKTKKELIILAKGYNLIFTDKDKKEDIVKALAEVVIEVEG